MSHTIDDKTNLLAQTKRLRERAEALEGLLAKEVSCEEVMTIVADAHKIVQALADEVGEDHDEVHRRAS